MNIFNVHLNGGGGGGPPSYTHHRFSVDEKEVSSPFTNGQLCGCATDGGRECSWFFDTALGTESGYETVVAKVYIVITDLHVHTSFPDDLPLATADIFVNCSEQANQGTQGSYGGAAGPVPDADIDSVVDFEPCFSNGTRTDD